MHGDYSLCNVAHENTIRIHDDSVIQKTSYIFFQKEKSLSLLFSRRIKGHHYILPLCGLQTNKLPESAAGGKGLTAKEVVPSQNCLIINKRTVLTSTSTEHQKELNSNPKEDTLSNQNKYKGERNPFTMLRRAEKYLEKPNGS